MNISQDTVPFTRIPNFFLDEMMSKLSPTELRVMLYIYRHTIGYGKSADAISYDQFQFGIVTRDGRRLDNGAGVSRRALVPALSSLERSGLISRHHQGYTAVALIELAPVPDLLKPSPPPNLHEVIAEAVIATTTGPVIPAIAARPAVTEVIRTTTVEIPTEVITNFPVSVGVPLPMDSALPEVVANEQVQNLRVEVEAEVQNLRGEAHNEVQILHPTKETKLNQKKENRVENPAAEFIVEKVSGISLEEADKLIGIANRNGRDEGYLTRLVEYVSNSPTIRIPAAVLTTLVKNNQDRTLTVPKSLSGISYSRPATLYTTDQKPRTESRIYSREIVEDVSETLPTVPALSVEECQAIWEKARGEVDRLWNIRLNTTEGGALLPGDEPNCLILKTPPPAPGMLRDGMMCIRLSQAIKSVLGTSEYHLEW